MTRDFRDDCPRCASFTLDEIDRDAAEAARKDSPSGI
jgi:hypothetical protein